VSLRVAKCVTLKLLVINISSFSPAINTAAYYQRCIDVAVVGILLYMPFGTRKLEWRDYPMVKIF